MIPKWIRKLILNTPPQAGAYWSNGLRMYSNLMHQTYRSKKKPNAPNLLDMYLIQWVDMRSLEKSPELSTRRVDVTGVRHDRKMCCWN